MTTVHALQVERLGKLYKLYDSPGDRLRALLTRTDRHRPYWALADLTFSLARGQCLGLVGDNGAGKSTLLKLVAGTLQPSTGRLSRQGRLTAILELGAGFHPEFTGRENLYFGGALIGIGDRDMKRLEAQIIAFAELEQAIDRPVKTYSSGMVVRLAFALVTAVEPDILIIDEALAVGDQHFQKKCIERIEAFRSRGCTILFCSHSLYHVRQLCDTALWLDSGRAQAFGPTETVIAAYEAHVRALNGEQATPSLTPSPQRHLAPPGEEQRAALLSVDIADLGAGDPPLLNSRDLSVTVRARCLDNEPPSIGVMLEQARGVGITSVATHVDQVTPTRSPDGGWVATVTFPSLSLHTGEFVVSAYLADGRGMIIYDEWLHCTTFTLVNDARMPGLVDLPHRWS